MEDRTALTPDRILNKGTHQGPPTQCVSCAGIIRQGYTCFVRRAPRQTYCSSCGDSSKPYTA